MLNEHLAIGSHLLHSCRAPSLAEVMWELQTGYDQHDQRLAVLEPRMSLLLVRFHFLVVLSVQDVHLVISIFVHSFSAITINQNSLGIHVTFLSASPVQSKSSHSSTSPVQEQLSFKASVPFHLDAFDDLHRVPFPSPLTQIPPHTSYFIAGSGTWQRCRSLVPRWIARLYRLAHPPRKEMIRSAF